MTQFSEPYAALSNWLVARKHNIHHRQLIWVSGNQDWANEFAEQLLNVTEATHTVWIGKRVSNATNIDHHNFASILGSEYSCAVYDAFQTFNLNALFAVAGTVKASGVILLLCPRLDQWAGNCQCLPSQSHGWRSAHSHFIDYMCTYLTNDTKVLKVFQNQMDCNQQHLPSALADIQLVDKQQGEQSLNPDQAQIIDHIMLNLAHDKPYVASIVAQRGRGKSYLLGWLLQLLINRRKKVALVAPQAKSSQQVFKHLTHQRASQWFTFCAPDDKVLIEETFDWVVVDEAAAIPVPMLERILSHQQKWVFSTTLGGYEGSASGFSLRFIDPLKTNSDYLLEQFKLTKPMRWYQGDFLEQTMQSLLTFARSSEDLHRGSFKADNINLQFKQISRPILANQPSLAKQIYAILASAHYQTSPNDFVRILDASDAKTFALLSGDTMVAAALCIEEGGDKLNDLARSIATGARRVRGHLTPQYMSYNTTNSAFSTLSYLRINRIAVTHNLHNLGIGSRLIQEIKQFASNSGFNIISTTFGASPGLTRFWDNNGFSQFKLGQKKDKASGLNSAMYLFSLNPNSAQLIEENKVLDHSQQRQKLVDFAQGNRDLSSCRLALNYHSLKLNSILVDHSDNALLNFVATTPTATEATIVRKFNLNGKKQLRVRLVALLQSALRVLT